ncbi:response regulator [Terriglobus roseus]|uniref:DNA-binding response regulator, OmpR family, contains REC and winged-helix (WHTH) domain n=1 Tax=Terriglobus roseus TaxID=392734 RepID=A0A1G7MPC8_9BACT|nr:response regulator [Terriglobus roseus]SDF63496.1 DNA-binding response regulator, OmpR family, contains REC and winged-helix (wHTH) domain [Terriglobus roseus]
MERLLLIDDDETTREVLTLLLTAEGWVVTEASSGEEALAKAPSIAPEVILSDLQMPGLSGEELASHLRSACPNKPVLLAMTATPKGHISGYDGLLTKPFAPSEVRRISRPPTTQEQDQTIDPATFQRIRRAMATPQLRALYDFALTDAEQRVHRMEAAATADDPTTLCNEAHAMKGSCGMIGATRLRTLASTLEDAGLASSMPPPVFPEFIREINHVRRMLEELLLRDL